MAIKRIKIRFGIVSILALGLTLRLYMSAKAFYSTFDTSTVGLMGFHILEGEFPLFYYGQNYMGALEAYTAALMFSIFGVSTFSLSLAPILFALGWIFTTYLLFTKLYGQRGGIAAALCVAVPGWYGLWFSMGSYGGYSVLYFLGTLFIYLSLLTEHSLKRHSPWFLSIAMGCVFALGVWTNLQFLSYLVTGCLILFVLLVRNHFDRKLLWPLSVTIIIGLSGFIPFILSLKNCGFSSGTMNSPSLKYVLENLEIMFRTLAKCLLWPTHNPITGWIILTVCLMPPFFLYLYCLAGKDVRKNEKFYVPVIFCIVFFCFFLPHPMAALGAPRYLIPMITMLTSAVFASAVSYNNKRIVTTGWALLGIWVIFNIHGTLATAVEKSTVKNSITAERDKVVSYSTQEGLHHVIIIGSEIDGNRGQSFSFHAKDQIRFVSSRNERYEPASLSTELDQNPGFICQTQHLKKVRRSFKLAGVKSIKVEKGKWNLLHHPLLLPSARISILPDKVSSRTKEWNQNSPLFDRNIDTEERLKNGERTIKIRMDFGREVLLDSLWVLPGKSQYLPNRYEIKISQDGIKYTHIAGSLEETIIPVYSNSGRLYVMGNYDRMDLDIGRIKARYLQFEMANTRSKAVVSELVIFEKLEQQVSETKDEIAAIHSYASKKDIAFIIADRWLSARLEEETRIKGVGPKVYPLYNRRFKRTFIDRCIIPDVGLCFAVPMAFADETLSFLQENLPGSDISKRNFSSYSLLEIKQMGASSLDKGSFLYWNGHMLTKSMECKTL